MKKTSIVNIYNFIRMTCQEPIQFVEADFETVARQIRTVKKYGMPGTYALKYDALMNERYQELMWKALDEFDEIGAWWEITRELCGRAGVAFRGIQTDTYEERVDGTYSLGYTPKERRLLLDAYMEDFYKIFGYYPKTIGSWVLDNVTVEHAREKYGVLGAAICRDQIGTDGFTLWGGWPNGMYFPSKKNLYLPSQTREETLPVPVFRLLGAEPVLSFEQDVRKGQTGVCTMEPCCYCGRNPELIRGFFFGITEQDGAGIRYAQVGQENSFLWDNIRPGFETQLKQLKELLDKGVVRVETMQESAEWFAKKYRLTPPLGWQSSVTLTSRLGSEHIGETLQTQWYASRFGRLSFLAEQRHLRIRDWFLYRENYPCRYLDKPMATPVSTFDALPLMFPQKWGGAEHRPFVRIMEKKEGTWTEAEGEICFSAPDEFSVAAELKTESKIYRFIVQENSLSLETDSADGEFMLKFDALPVYAGHEGQYISCQHEGFSYSVTVDCGKLVSADKAGVEILAEERQIRLSLSEDDVEETELFTETYKNNPEEFNQWNPVWKDNPEVKRILSTDPVFDFLPAEEPEVTEAKGWKDVQLQSDITFDLRPVFDCSGIMGLLKETKGSTDWQDEHWLATGGHFDVTCVLPEERLISNIAMGFLTNHRAGIIFPEALELYIGEDPEHLELFEMKRLPEGPAEKEIQRSEFVFAPNVRTKCFRFVAKRYALMPQWCCYKGITGVYTLADCLMIS